MLYNLDRFKKAQESTFDTALKEIKAGNKETHWIWFIFPQLKGLGNSSLADYYGIENLDEAKAYMKDSKLRNNLIKITRVLLANNSSDIKSILGYPDDLKLKSCMTLFFYTGVETELFKNVIDKFYNGVFDIKTVSLLEKFNEVYIRNTNFDDLDNVLKLYECARIFMAKIGNPNQWKNNRPSLDTIKNDINNNNSYVIINNGKICAVFSFIIGNDATYDYIKDGKWLNDAPYGTIHRIASNGDVKGVFEKTLEFCFSKIDNIRIDTHKDNKIMLHLVEKYNFKKCGIVFVDDGTERIAFQCVNK